MPKKSASRRARPKHVLLAVDETTRHPGALNKRLTNWCNDNGVFGVGRLVLLGLQTHADSEGWAWPGSRPLAAFAGCNERTVTEALSTLCHKGALGRIDWVERRELGRLRKPGGPKNQVPPKVRLYLLRTVATADALAWFDEAQRVVGRAPPSSPERTRWTLSGEAFARHLPADIIDLIRKRTLGADDLVMAEGMRDMVRVAEVPYFAEHLPPPWKYFLSPAADHGLTEAQLADAVRAGARLPERLERDDGAKVSLRTLPMVAAAEREKRLRDSAPDNGDAVARAG